MINESPGAGFFTDVFKTYVRRGLTWYVSKREEHLAAAVYGHNDWGHPWQRQLMTEVMPGASVIEVIDNLYFSSVRLVACAERSIPLDDVPWEIHDIMDPIAYEAALSSYKDAMALSQ